MQKNRDSMIIKMPGKGGSHIDSFSFVGLKESLNGNIVVFLFKKTQIKDK